MSSYLTINQMQHKILATIFFLVFHESVLQRKDFSTYFIRENNFSSIVQDPITGNVENGLLESIKTEFPT